MSRTVNLPAGSQFSCRSCGNCCRGWAVPVDRETVDRLRRHDWGGDPFEPTGDGSAPFRIRLVEDRCFFLDRENRCRIHRELSYDAKPAVCRAFPLAVLDVGGTRYARLSFWCPTVVANTGKPLVQQARWVNETAREAGRRDAPLTIDGAAELESRSFERIHQTLREWLGDRSLTVADRLSAGSVLIQRVASAADGKRTAVERLLDTARSEGAASLADEGRRRGDPSGGRRLLIALLLADRRPGRIAGARRLAALVLFSAGLTSLRSRVLGTSASWRRIRNVGFNPSGVADDLLTRYFCTKLDSRRYLAGNATLVVGFNLLVTAYGLINVLARLRAAAAGRARTSDEDIQEAVRAADFLYVEHGGTAHTPLQQRLTGLMLDQPRLCADLLARLEGCRREGATAA